MGQCLNDEDVECLKLEYKEAMSVLQQQMEEALELLLTGLLTQ